MAQELREDEDAKTDEKSRDRLWESTFETYYDACYDEIFTSKHLKRWVTFDTVSRLLVALTSSGSAIAGWALWSLAGYKPIWAFVAGCSAVLAIAHSLLETSKRIEEISENKQSFVLLRNDLETFRQQMSIFPTFPLSDFNSDFLKFRERLKVTQSRFRDDLLSSEKLANESQEELDLRLKR